MNRLGPVQADHWVQSVSRGPVRTFSGCTVSATMPSVDCSLFLLLIIIHPLHPFVFSDRFLLLNERQSMELSLEHTPTWVAAVIFFFAVAVSYILVQLFNYAGNVRFMPCVFLLYIMSSALNDHELLLLLLHVCSGSGVIIRLLCSMLSISWKRVSWNNPTIFLLLWLCPATEVSVLKYSLGCRADDSWNLISGFSGCAKTCFTYLRATQSSKCYASLPRSNQHHLWFLCC